MKKRMYRVVSAAAVALVVAVSGCAQAPEQEPATELRIGTSTEVTNWSPLNSFSVSDFWVQGMLYPPLITMTPEGELEPFIAAEYEVLADGSGLRLVLDERFKWSDGEPIDAHDVKFTFDRFKADRLLNGSSIAPNYQEAEVLSDYELVLRSVHPSYDWGLDALRSTSILPEHVFSRFDNLADVQVNQDETLWVSGGSWNLSYIVEGQFYEFVPNEHYPLRAPGNETITKVVFAVYPDASTLQLALRSGDLDLSAPVIQPAALPGLAADSHIGIEEVPAGLNYTKLTFNASGGLMADAQVRRVISGVLDLDALLNVVLQGRGMTLTGPVLPIYPEYQPEITPWQFTDDEARAALAGTGYQDQPITILCDIGNANHLKYAQLIRDRLLAIGFQVKLGCAERSTSLAQAKAGEFDLYVHKLNQSWTAGTNLVLQYHPDNPSGIGYNFVDDHHLAALLDAIGAAVSGEEYASTIQAAAAYIHEQAYVLPLAVESLNSAYRADRFTGFIATGMESSTMVSPRSLGNVVPNPDR